MTISEWLQAIWAWLCIVVVAGAVGLLARLI
jgi:hypothetical protein